MNTTEKEYCRLCAEKKLRNKLINFQNDSELWQKIVDKLSRFSIFIDLHENILPRTVCRLCSMSLESAFTFVTMVEHAQATLIDFTVVGDQKEENDSDDKNIFNDLSDDSSMDTNNEIDQIKFDNEKCNNVQLKHQTPTINSFCADKTDNAPSNINIEVNKNNNVDTTQVIMGNEEYSAEFIDKQINRLAVVPLHAIKNTWKDFNWKCSYCETIFPNADELQSHSMQYHNTCNTYKCIDCNTRTSKLNVFIRHVRKHRKYLHYSCYKCFRKFTNPHDARRHKWFHYTSDYICLGCNTTFSSQDELETHVGAFYKILCQKKNKFHWPDDNFTCNECEKSFKTSISLSKHLVVHTNRKRDYFCEICGKGFYNKVTLIRHMFVHSDTKPYQCEICKLNFKNIKYLRDHAKVHLGQKPFMCDQCDQCFREKKHLAVHCRIHLDLLPHSCTQCDKKFRTKSQVKKHMRQHTGEKPYSCQICERTFRDWGNYNKHMKRKHGTDKSKKKYTPLGPHAVDPTTGDFIYPKMDKVLE